MEGWGNFAHVGEILFLDDAEYVDGWGNLAHVGKILFLGRKVAPGPQSLGRPFGLRSPDDLCPTQYSDGVVNWWVSPGELPFAPTSGSFPTV